MTEQLRNFLTEHRELIENEDFYNLVNSAGAGASYYTELLQMLHECGVFDSYDDFLKEFIVKFEKETYAIAKKHGVSGFTSILSTGRYSVYNATSFEKICNSASKTIEMLPAATRAIPPKLSNGYQPLIYLDRFIYRVSLHHGDEYSSEFKCDPPITQFFFLDIMDPEKLNQHLKNYLSRYEQFCIQTNECIDKCIESFGWIEKAKKYANDIALELKNRSSEYIEIEPNVVHAGNGVFINTGLKNTKDNIRIIIPCDSDPSGFDAEKAIKECIAKIKRLANYQVKAKKAQAEVEKQRPENYKAITRKDITACMKELGIDPSGTVYTNKYSNITTYKWAYRHVSPENCKRLENKLREIGADVESVECRVGGTGWRSYSSLFVKVRN